MGKKAKFSEDGFEDGFEEDEFNDEFREDDVVAEVQEEKEVKVNEFVEAPSEGIVVELEDDTYIISATGSRTFRLDKDGCRKGWKWNPEVGRCQPE